MTPHWAYLFVAGAALTSLGAMSFTSGWSSEARRWWGWAATAAGLAGFGLALGRSPLVAFLALFAIPTALLGWEALKTGRGRATFLAFALSDACLAAAITVHQSAGLLGGGWKTPPPAAFGAGAPLLVAAAAIRLGGMLGGSDRPSGLSLTGWWQGACLAWLAGPPARWPLLAAAAAALAGGIWLSRSARPGSGFLLGGGLVCVLAASGSGAAAMSVAALAGAAHGMGERTISSWILGVLPVSAAFGLLPSAGVRHWMLAPLAAGPLVWAGLIAHLWPEDRAEAGTPHQAGLVAALAALGGALALAARTSASLMWAVYGVGLSAALAAALGGTFTYTPHTSHQDQEPAAAASAPSAWNPLFLAGGAALGVALVLAARLALVGLGTGFL